MIKRKRRKLNILFVTEFFPTTTTLNVAGGVEVRTYNIAIYLAKKHNIYVIATREQGNPDYQKIKGVTVLRPGYQSRYSNSGNFISRLLFILSAMRTILSLKLDLIEGTGFLGQVVVRMVKKTRDVKTVAFVPDTVSNFSHQLGFVEKLVLPFTERIVLNGFWNGYIVISKAVKKKLVKLGVPSTKIRTIYCGIDFNKLIKNNPKKTSYPSICVISRLVGYKNIDVIISAIIIVKRTISNVRCNIIGRGELFKKYLKMIQKLHLEKNIKLQGFIANHSKVLGILKSSWLYCSASTVEGFGIATVEAMVSKVPFVITDIPVNREVTNRKGGLFFQPKDSHDLAQKIINVITQVKRKIFFPVNPRNLHKYSTEYMGKSTQNYFNYLMNS